jgi:hypothetical protein
MYLPPTYSPAYSPNQLITYFPPIDYLQITYLATYIFSPSYNLPTYYIPTYPLTYLPKFTQILTIKLNIRCNHYVYPLDLTLSWAIKFGHYV